MWTVKTENGEYWRNQNGRQLGEKMTLDEMLTYCFERALNDKYARNFLVFGTGFTENAVKWMARNQKVVQNVSQTKQQFLKF